MGLHFKSCLYYLCFVVPSLSRAVPTSQPTSITQKRDASCGFEGNPDLYGLGIRLGVYMQWASALVICNFNPEGRSELANAYLAFITAVSLAVLIITARADPTYAAEIMVLTYIIFGGVYTIMGVGMRKSMRARLPKVNKFQAVTLFLVLAGAAIYCSWFWLHGLFKDFEETPCGTFGFLFSKVSLYNLSVTRFFAFVSISAALGYSWGLWVILSPLVEERLPSSWATVRSITQRLQLRLRKAAVSDAQRAKATSLQNETNQGRFSFEQRLLTVLLVGTNLFAFIYSALGIELTIYWNSIRSMYTIDTTGQLIPFVVGAVGLFGAIYGAIYPEAKRAEDHILGETEHPPIEAEHKSNTAVIIDSECVN
ncbi:hypothetical protein F5884DRAFT_826984 [Xylogone sp. PMI_703]|nr:hypothetical protein F5884DRAFT_826984 [Xylogone sp. PMI_703]